KKIIVRRKVKMLPENFEPITAPEMIHKNDNPKNYYNSYQKAKEVTKEFDKMFTLDDYKLLLRMLTEQREKEKLSAKNVELASEKALKEQALRLEKEKQEALRKEELRLEKERQEALRQEELRLEKEKAEALRLEKLRLERLKEQELEREQEKLTELEMLYRSIR
ncbi:MAG: hypothetical protein IJI22_01735, partial [Bacilli bacterium]|nr:hypothetical protein [Bacilli bacterium]